MVLLKSKRMREIWNLIKVAMFNILFAHCLATILLGMSRYNPEDNWLISFYGEEVETVGWFEIYVTGLYWAATIMMSVGFGEITPSTNE